MLTATSNAARTRWRPGVLIAALLGFAVLAALIAGNRFASAGVPAAPQSFAPFTATITTWTEMSGTLEGRQNGLTQVFRLSYRNANSWDMTLTTHSLDRSYEGTTWRMEGQTSTTFDAQKNATRTLTVENGATNAPDAWLIPGVKGRLPSSGYTQVAGPADRDVYRETLSTESGGVVNTTTYPRGSELPLEVTSTRTGLLISRRLYAVQ